MISSFHSTATSGQLGLVQLHQGRGLLLVGLLANITGGPVKLIDPYGDYVIGGSGPIIRFSAESSAAMVYELQISIAPTTADWLIYYRLW